MCIAQFSGGHLGLPGHHLGHCAGIVFGNFPGLPTKPGKSWELPEEISGSVRGGVPQKFSKNGKRSRNGSPGHGFGSRPLNWLSFFADNPFPATPGPREAGKNTENRPDKFQKETNLFKPPSWQTPFLAAPDPFWMTFGPIRPSPPLSDHTGGRLSRWSTVLRRACVA